MSLSVTEKSFYLNNKPIQIISGAIHYFRIHPKQWRDRLLKAKDMGLNTIETYVAWNIHEPEEGIFKFKDFGDIEKFLSLAQEVGLNVILRPSPYICAEWEFGGLPYWLLSYDNMRLRCYDKEFINKINNYYDRLIPKITPYLSTNGGPIIAVQVENEYGSYGNDNEYLKYIKEALVNRGIDVLLFTSDGPSNLMLEGGKVDDYVLQTVNFGSKPKEYFYVLSSLQNNKPIMCMEYWNGWFDHWGEQHHVRDYKDASQCLDEMLAMKASVNLYMFNGGTNFGFYNGANYDMQSSLYQPTITSYDYDSALTEYGALTDKYNAFKCVIRRYKDVEDINISHENIITVPEIKLNKFGNIFSVLDHIKEGGVVKNSYPLTFEELKQDYGFVLYETKLPNLLGKHKITVDGLCDRCLIFINKEYKATLYRNDKNYMEVEIEIQNSTIQILVENMGRINYGPMLGERKGILKGVKFDYQYLFNWDMYRLPFRNNEESNYAIYNIELQIKESNNILKDINIPSFYKGEFSLSEVGSMFLNMEEWSKGIVFINGFNVGRYWNEGPQKTLYIPWAILKSGQNIIEVFELHKSNECKIVRFMANHILQLNYLK